MKPSQRTTYTIQVAGHLDPRYAHWFEDMTVSTGFADEEPVTVLCGVLPDQAALYGVLGKLQAMNIPLLSVSQQPT